MSEQNHKAYCDPEFCKYGDPACPVGIYTHLDSQLPPIEQPIDHTTKINSDSKVANCACGRKYLKSGYPDGHCRVGRLDARVKELEKDHAIVVESHGLQVGLNRKLSAENARLKSALEKIASCKSIVAGDCPSIAQEALKEKNNAE